MNEIAESVRELTKSVDALGQQNHFVTEALIPIGSALLSAFVVIFVLAFQHRVRRKELDLEATLREEERKEARRVLAEAKAEDLAAQQKAARSRVARSLIEAFSEAGVARTLLGQESHAQEALRALVNAQNRLEYTTAIDLPDEEFELAGWGLQVSMDITHGPDQGAASTLSGNSAALVRFWKDGRMSASEVIAKSAELA